MKSSKLLACLLPLLVGAAHAQDERRIVSPDGHLEFRLFTSVPEGSVLNCLAYQVRWRGKPIFDTSYLGWNIHFQEPLLGENVGLSTEKQLHGTDYNGLWADYLQTSSTGRRIQFEVRVWNDGVAFRYTIPQSALLLNLLIEDDATEFHFAQDAAGARPAQAALPYVEQDPGIGWLGIFESPAAGFPRMYLVRTGAHTMTARLPQKPNDPGVAFDGATPWTSPWRMIAVAPDRERLAQSQMVRELGK
jgi:alpha-glucosidase